MVIFHFFLIQTPLLPFDFVHPSYLLPSSPFLFWFQFWQFWGQSEGVGIGIFLELWVLEIFRWNSDLVGGPQNLEGATMSAADYHHHKNILCCWMAWNWYVCNTDRCTVLHADTSLALCMQCWCTLFWADGIFIPVHHGIGLHPSLVSDTMWCYHTQYIACKTILYLPNHCCMIHVMQNYVM